MFTFDSKINEILSSKKGMVVLGKYLPLFKDFPNLCQIKALDLNSIMGCMGITKEIAEKIIMDMNRPTEEILPKIKERKSLDEIERERFKAGPSPFDIKPENIGLIKGNVEHSRVNMEILLDGEWQMAEECVIEDRLSGVWKDAILARVPGSVHTALFEAGRIPDPTVGTNQRITRKESYKTWWMKKCFKYPEGIKLERLVFGGVCNKCTVWLNGQELGSHEGMFGGPEYDISEYLNEENTLIVKLEPIPYEPSDPNSTHIDIDNISWQKTVVFNNVYGWHYSNLPSLGIWRSVKVCGVPDVTMPNPFIATKNAVQGMMKLSIHFDGKVDHWSGVLKGSVEPENFKGDEYFFEKELNCSNRNLDINMEFEIPNPRLWWPNDLGEQNLYKMKLSFEPVRGIPDYREFVFGIRTVEMMPLPDGPRPDKYNWTFKINGEERFIKGTGWCTMDPLMDFSRERYQRFISLAKLQHVQMMRAWGCGMPETDDFYDLCNRNGIMILQEWPTTWNVHDVQPYDVLEETVRLNTLRIRNHASLVMWGAGNESSHPYGKAIDMMGKLSIELDGTRPYHTGEPWGGSVHNYDCYWGRKHLDYNLNMEADFFGEFGLACMPVYESVQRYLQEDENQVWPPKSDGELVYHTPIFGRADDLSRLTQYAGELKGSKWKVVVRAFNSNLNEIRKAEFEGEDIIKSPTKLGRFELTYEETDTTPLLIVSEVVKNGILADRTFYWLNYEAEKGCLFRLPETHLSLSKQGKSVTVKNTGTLPAVAVNISRPGYLHIFTVSDNYFWLDPGEEKAVEVDDTEGVAVSAWNA